MRDNKYNWFRVNFSPEVFVSVAACLVGSSYGESTGTKHSHPLDTISSFIFVKDSL